MGQTRLLALQLVQQLPRDPAAGSSPAMVGSSEMCGMLPTPCPGERLEQMQHGARSAPIWA